MSPTDRRAFLKQSSRILASSIGLGSIGAVAGSPGRQQRVQNSGTGQEKVSERQTSVRGRIRTTDPSELHRAYREAYGPAAAGRVVSLWKKYSNAVLRGDLSSQEAYETLVDEAKGLSPDLAADIEAVEKAKNTAGYGIDSPLQQRVEAGEVDPSDDTVDRVTSGGGLSLLSSKSIYLAEGGTGGEGYTGFRDSAYNTGKNKVVSICEQAGFGSLSQWAWLEGNVYVDDGGNYEIVCDYFENGLIVGGSASYDIWIQEEGEDHKTWKTLRSTSSSVYGNDERAVQFALSSDTIYNVGVRLLTSTSGIGEALCDYQTINSDGSVRGLEINDFQIEPI